MDRRRFRLTSLAGAFAAPLAAEAQPTTPPPRIAVVLPAIPLGEMSRPDRASHPARALLHGLNG
jgi:hypothetical protein